MKSLLDYAKALCGRAGRTFQSGEVFAKVLTPNDDSGKHGVLIPTDAYSYFPYLPIQHPDANATEEFPAFDTLAARQTTLAYKYYQRYPERRITRLHTIISDRKNEPRLVVFLHAKHADGGSGYYFDCANSAPQGRFSELFQLIFGNEVAPQPGNFVVRPVDSAAFAADYALAELLDEFDRVNQLGWIDSLREGDTGIGYTFETMLGIKENNDQNADFKGIEIKCKGMKKGALAATGKTNLFQAGPTWLVEGSAKERIRILGKQLASGLYACHSQVTTTANNLGLLLAVLATDKKIDLRKSADALGYWSFDRLEKRLTEKHSRAVFVKASTRKAQGRNQFCYQELVYCEKPSIARFVDLVATHDIVFEFLMSEKQNGSIRNHGYPWRLTRQEYLEQLFAYQIRLR